MRFNPSMRFDVRFDTRDVERSLRRLGKDAPIAMSRALNRTVGTVQTRVTRAISKDVGVTQKDVRKSLEIQRASTVRLVATLIITGARMPLSRFRARQTKRGVTYRLPGGRSFVPHAFIARVFSRRQAEMGVSHEGVFRRRGKARLPIDELRGPSLPRIFSRARMRTFMRQVARDVMAKNLAHEVKFILRGRRRS